jgi:hypothetical protein
MQNLVSYLKELRTIEFKKEYHQDLAYLSLSHYIPIHSYFEKLESYRFDAQFDIETNNFEKLDLIKAANDDLHVLQKSLVEKNDTLRNQLLGVFKKMILLNFDRAACYDPHTLTLLNDITRAKIESAENLMKEYNIISNPDKVLIRKRVINDDDSITIIVSDLSAYHENEDLINLRKLMYGDKIEDKIIFKGDAVVLITYFSEIVENKITHYSKAEIIRFLVSHFSYQSGNKINDLSEHYVSNIIYKKKSFIPQCPIVSDLFR